MLNNYIIIKYMTTTDATIISDLNTEIDEQNTQLNTDVDTQNSNNSILFRQNELLEVKNNILNGQLTELEQIQSIISTKDKLLDITNYDLSKKSSIIKILFIGIFISIFLLILTGIYGSGVIDDTKYLAIISILIFIFIFYILYIYNTFNVSSYTHAISNKYLVGKGINSLSKSINDKIRTDIYGNEQDWIKSNCNQPCDIKDESNDIINDEDTSSTPIGDTAVQVTTTPGYYYKDSAGPKQLLYPQPTEANSSNAIFQIQPNISTLSGTTYTANL